MPGAFVLLLTAHQPWLAAAEEGARESLTLAWASAYVPLLDLLERLHQGGVRAPVVLAVSPTLLALLENGDLRRSAIDSLAEREALCVQGRGRPGMAEALDFHRARFCRAREALERPDGDLRARLTRLAEDGAVELLACPGTNAVLPLFPQAHALAAQLRLAASEHRHRFGRVPPGLWLPECGYDARVGSAAAAAGFEHVVLEHHALERARPRPRCGPYAPVRLPGGGVFAFGRDPGAARAFQLLGPFAHPDFAEPNRDAGTELRARALGLLCHRVTGTGSLAERDFYNPERARLAAQEQADAFALATQKRAQELAVELKTRPVLVAALEAERFGPDWLEGPVFLERLLRKLASNEAMQPRTLDWVTAHAAEAEEAEPDASSWGPGGYFEAWLNDENAWALPHAHGATERMLELAARFGPRAQAYPTALEERALNACARLCVLIQSSDMPRERSSRPSHALSPIGREGVASQQTSFAAYFGEWVADFLELLGQLDGRRVQAEPVTRIERLCALLPSADFRMFS